ncbi:MAG: hypothetical protein WA058_02120 [Minisyncoccia bacterium]
MHYKNGREAKEGDKVVCIGGGMIVTGILHSVNAQSDTCNGRLAPTSQSDPYVNIKDCLHIDDVAAAEIPDTTKAG